MSSDNVFDGIVAEENSYTRLLCNVMRISDDFRNGVLGRFLPSKLASRIAGDSIQTQVNLGEGGTPDIEMLARDLCVFIEVKSDPKCPLTANQELAFDVEREFKGYLGALSRRQGKKWLVYLVPLNWVYLEQLKRSQNESAKKLSSAGIKIHIMHWEDILKISQCDCTKPTNPLVNEFGKLLASQFGPFKLKQEEVEMLLSKDFPAACRTVLKLQGLVERIAQKAKETGGYSVRFGNAELRDRDGPEYGYYLYNAKNKSPLLWFGVEPGFSEQGFPICVVVYHDSDKEKKLQTALSSIQKALGNDHPVEEIWKQLARLLEGFEKPTLGGKELPRDVSHKPRKARAKP
jgi:hypothetical protein